MRFNRELNDIGRIRFLVTDLLVMNSPELVHALLVEHHASLSKSRFLRTVLDPLVGRGLFTSEGELWQRQRRLMAPIFHRSRIGAFDREMTDAATRCIDRWEEGASIDASEEMTRVAMSVASQTLFSVDTFDEADEIGDALAVALRWSADISTTVSLGAQVTLAEGLDALARRLPAGLRGPLHSAANSLEHPVRWPGEKSRRLEEAIALLDDRVAEMIAARRASPEGYDDLLSRLLAARDEDGGMMDDRQLRDEVLTLFVAGHETTATALAWALYLLARHPEIREALETEADALEGRVPTADDLGRLPLSRRIFAETLRLYPPVPVYERQALEDVEVAGIELPVGSYVAVFPWALHHNPTVWDDPERFDPDRFTEERERARHRYAWIPFGAGPRVCIGNHFALQEGPLVLSCIAARARLALVSDAEIRPDPAAATLRPRGGVPMRVTLRRKSGAG